MITTRRLPCNTPWSMISLKSSGGATARVAKMTTKDNKDGDQEPVGLREPQDAPNHTRAELMLGNIGILRHAPHHHVHRHGLPPGLERTALPGYSAPAIGSSAMTSVRLRRLQEHSVKCSAALAADGAAGASPKATKKPEPREPMSERNGRSVKARRQLLPGLDDELAISASWRPPSWQGLSSPLSSSQEPWRLPSWREPSSPASSWLQSS